MVLRTGRDSEFKSRSLTRECMCLLLKSNIFINELSVWSRGTVLNEAPHVNLIQTSLCYP